MESTKPGASQERGPPGGISIDRLIGKKIGAGDAFSSTVSGRGICVSADGPGQSVPLIGSPAKAFDTYFGRRRTGRACRAAAGAAAAREELRQGPQLPRSSCAATSAG